MGTVDERPHDGGAGPAARPQQQAIGGMDRSSRVQAVRDRVPDGLVGAARASIHAVGRTTAAARVLPDFLIIGSKKGGTTSMMNWLVEHPDVARMFPSFQKRKSPHYFDINYWRGEAWYRAHFPTRATQHRAEQRTGVRPLLGEASPYYMFHPAVPGRVRETLPEARMIALLREPVSRAYSNYWDRVATGNEALPTFEAAIDAEASRLEGVTTAKLQDPRYYSFDHDHHTYLARGRYAEHLAPWFETFGPDQMLVLPAEGMFRRPQETYEQVLGFLGLRSVDVPLRARNERKGYPPLDGETKQRLKEYYAPHNQALYELLGTDLGW